MSDSSLLRITFLGGASAIGASCALVETDAANVVIDCGIRFEPGHALPDLAALGGKRLDAIVLTHAHTDHSGALPVLCDAFPGTPVYATPPTIELVGILLRDALKLMRSAEREAEVPLYAEAQVEQALHAMLPVPFGGSVEVFGCTITWLPASHILGAAMVHMATPAGRLLFTGDYSVSPQMTVPALMRPALGADVIVSEATYGERLHEDRSTAERRLVEQLRQVVDAGGRVLIPAFAVGRAQEVLRILKRALARGDLKGVPVYVDGMVRAVCDVYRRHERYVSRQLAAEIRRGAHPFYTDDIRPVEGPADRARALGGNPCVIVASSGMLSGGASVLYARELASQARDAILITGYQDEESPGRALLSMAAGDGPRALRLGGEPIDVACSVAAYGLSAHADRMQMSGLLEAIGPRTVVLVHGGASAKAALGRALSCRDVVLAEDGQVVVRHGRAGAPATCPVGPTLPEARDVDRVRQALGPPRDESLRDRQIAEAWFGQDTANADVDRLITRLEDLGLVRRDDRRRNRVWILAPDESDAYPEEAAVQDQLKADNPKGRLLELCMRMRSAAPVTELAVQGAYHVAAMTLDVGSRRIESGPQRAASRKTAEQLAAARMLELLEKELALGDAVTVGEEAGAALQRANPKGRLLEWCARERLSAPQFEQRSTTAGSAVRVVVAATDGATHATRWHEAPSLRVAEQAAADEALGRVSCGSSSTAPAEPVLEPAGAARPDAVPLTTASRPEARMLLNELRQNGIVADFGYELRDHRGPSHQPIFVVVAWASVRDGSRLEGEPAEAPSKKAAQRDAAERLLDRLSEHGLVGRP
jgi:Cft2 family RNA processing exonuclease/dsRNA-specific ribonuclease